MLLNPTEMFTSRKDKFGGQVLDKISELKQMVRTKIMKDR